MCDIHVHNEGIISALVFWFVWLIPQKSQCFRALSSLLARQFFYFSIMNVLFDANNCINLYFLCDVNNVLELQGKLRWKRFEMLSFFMLVQYVVP